MKMLITLLVGLVLSLILVSGATYVTNLNVTSCSGATSCTYTEYNNNDTGIGHTIAKGQVGTSVWQTNIIPSSATILDVWFHLRHDSDGASNSWTFTFEPIGGGTDYCTDNTIAHVASDTYVTRNTTGSCSWTPGELNDLQILSASGDDKGSQDSFVTYMDVFITYEYTPPPDWTINLSSNDSILIGENVTYIGTATHDESNDYRMTVCNSSSYTSGYPATCDDTTYCTSDVTSSGSPTNCSYQATNVENFTAYSVICESSGSCNDEVLNTSTLVNQTYGTIGYEWYFPVNYTNVSQYDVFNVTMNVSCSGDTYDICGNLTAYLRYNDSSNDPDKLINETSGATPFYVQERVSINKSTNNSLAEDQGASQTGVYYRIAGDDSLNRSQGVFFIVVPNQTGDFYRLDLNISGNDGNDIASAGDIEFRICNMTGNTICDDTNLSECFTLDNTWDPTWTGVRWENITLDNTYPVIAGQPYTIYLNGSGVVSDEDNSADSLRLDALSSSGTAFPDGTDGTAQDSCLGKDPYLINAITHVNYSFSVQENSFLLSDVSSGESYEVYWNKINATDSNTAYYIDVEINSSYGEGNVSSKNTNNTFICMGDCSGAPPIDSCDYSSGDWSISCSDNCRITETNINSNNVYINGSGTFKWIRNITNAQKIKISGGCQATW